jgi:hypothetical protein
MLLHNGCPRCLRGDIIVRAEDRHVMASCLQCGYQREIKQVYDLRALSPSLVRTILDQDRARVVTGRS